MMYNGMPSVYNTMPSPMGYAGQPYGQQPYPPPTTRTTPQQQQQQQQQPQDSSADDENGGRTALLMTTGGLLGLTAAAAFRWLNGGEFVLLPDSENNAPDAGLSSSIDRASSWDRRNYQQRSGGNTVLSLQTNGDPSKTRDAEIVQEMQTLVTELRDQTKRQETLIQRLTVQENSRITDQSMNLLKQQQQQQQQTPVLPQQPSENQSGSSVLWEDLCAIHQQLDRLKDEMRATAASEPADAWISQLESITGRVQGCIDKTAPSSEKSIATSSESKDAGVAPDVPVVEEPPASAPEDKPSLEDKPNAAAESSIPEEKVAENTEEPEDASTMSLARIFETLIQENDSKPLQVGAQLLYLYANHLLKVPQQPRYKKIMISNESFQKVDRLQGGRRLLKALGFVEQPGQQCLEWLPTDNDDQSTAAGTAPAAADTGVNQEAFYLGRLRDASRALAILKSPAKSRDGAKDEILQQVLSKLSPSTTDAEPPQSQTETA